jgi:hypothetical protein
MVFAIRVEDPFDVTVQRSHHPIRANIVGPPRSATRIKASIAACHSGNLASFLGNVVTWVAASLRVTILRPSERAIGSSNSRAQPRSLMAPALLVELGLEAFGHPRLVAVGRFVAPWAGPCRRTTLAVKASAGALHRPSRYPRRGCLYRHLRAFRLERLRS